MKRAQWVEYERLAAKIIAELRPHADVRHDDHIFGNDSEARRQIDVSARWMDGDIARLLIVQVRDYRRRADVNVVGEFKSVIQDVRADRGVLICSGGFSKAALTYARNIGIDLYSLGDATSKMWKFELTVPTLWQKIVPYVKFSGKVDIAAAPVTFKLRESGSLPFFLAKDNSPYDLDASFKSAWDAGELKFRTGVEHHFKVEDRLALRGFDRAGDSVFVEIEDIAIRYTVDCVSYFGQLSPRDYRGLVNHLRDRCFVPSYLAVDIPLFESDAWVRIRDPRRLAVSVKGLIMTVADARIDSSVTEDITFERIGNSRKVR